MLLSPRVVPWTLALTVLVHGSRAAPVGLPDDGSSDRDGRLASFAAHRALKAEGRHGRHPWHFVGPTRMSGRATDVEIHPSDPQTLYVGAASGGVWKSEDDGASWRHLFDEAATSSIGDIAIAPSDPDHVWVGTGEANILRSTIAGCGVYRSTDGGETFVHVGLTDTHHIARICIDPRDPDHVYVGACGHEYTTNEERGVYETTDGGATWRRVFFQGSDVAVIDLAMDPDEPSNLYLGTAPRLRLRWNDPLPGPQSGVWKSDDGGASWIRPTAGLPDFSQGEYERVGLDVCSSHPETVYALLVRARGKVGAEIYRSDDRGANWRALDGNAQVRRSHPGYGWFFGQVRVAPSDPETVYCLGLQASVSRDGGTTWDGLRGTHVDYHGGWIDPADADHVVLINDGGVMISRDGFATHRRPDLPIAHTYDCAVSQEAGAFWIYSSIQDSGAWRGRIDLTDGRETVPRPVWDRTVGDEAGRHVIHPDEPDVVHYLRRYGGGPARSGDRSRGARLEFEEGARKRAQWVSPLVASPHDPQRLLYGAQNVFLSDDGGEHWSRISPDLTNFDPERQGNIAHAVLFALAESPAEQGVLWAGSDDGRVSLSRDDGKTWNDVSSGLPEGRCVASIAPGLHDASHVVVAVNGKRHDDLRAHLFVSRDFGATWQHASSNLPDQCINVVLQDPDHADVLYVGTDLGAYVTTDGGGRWDVLGRDLPTVPVHDLELQRTEEWMVAATHGRGCYLLDVRSLRAAQDGSDS